MPDLREADVEAIIAKLAHFGFLGEMLRGKSDAQRVQAFMERADNSSSAALREATSGAGFDFILRTEFNELASPANLAYTISCCVAVALKALPAFTRTSAPMPGQIHFKKIVVLRDLLKRRAHPSNPSGDDD